MNKTQLAEAAGFLRSVLAALLASASATTKIAGADLFRQVSALSLTAEAAISSSSLGTSLLGCFEAAYAAGASLVTIAQVRTLITGSTLIGAPGILVQQACLQMVLVEESRIMSNTALVSRQDVEAYLARMNAAFDPAETFAADAHVSTIYRALIALHAAVSQDLAARGRPLPEIVRYAYPRGMPALTLANRIYGDGSRANELIAENKPFHPAFMPRAGIALSS